MKKNNSARLKAIGSAKTKPALSNLSGKDFSTNRENFLGTGTRTSDRENYYRVNEKESQFERPLLPAYQYDNIGKYTG